MTRICCLYQSLPLASVSFSSPCCAVVIIQTSLQTRLQSSAHPWEHMKLHLWEHSERLLGNLSTMVMERRTLLLFLVHCQFFFSSHPPATPHLSPFTLLLFPSTLWHLPISLFPSLVYLLLIAIAHVSVLVIVVTIERLFEGMSVWMWACTCNILYDYTTAYKKPS